MGRVLIEGPKALQVTPSLSKRFCEMEPCPSDRPLKEDRVAKLTKAIKEGDFRTTEWASAFCKETGIEYRVNGKHTSTIFNMMNGDTPKDTKVIVSKYECDTLEDVAKLYCTFDPRISVRRVDDINRVIASSHESLSDIGSRVLSVAVSGMSFALWEQSWHRREASERAELMLKHPDFVIFVNTIISALPLKQVRHMVRYSVGAAMFKTFQKHQAKSLEFWSMVRDGSGPDHTKADRVLNKYLLTTNVDTGAGSRGNRRHDSPRAVYCKCLHAWNAWRSDETTDLRYYASAKTPAVK